MTESEGKCKKMGKEKRGRSFIAFTGAAAVLGIAANLAITAIKYQKAKNAKKKGTTSSQLFNFLLNVCLVNQVLKFKIVSLNPVVETCRSCRFYGAR